MHMAVSRGAGGEFSFLVQKCVDAIVFCNKKLFPLPSEDITKVSSLATLQLIEEKAHSELSVSYGYRITDSLSFTNVCNQLKIPLSQVLGLTFCNFVNSLPCSLDSVNNKASARMHGQ